MKPNNVVALIITAGYALVSFAQSNATPPAAAGAHYSGAELRRLERAAHTPQQYHVLASFSRGQQESYRQRATEEKQEWERRSVDVSGPAAKSPRPVNSARNLYEYYAQMADRAGQLASHYQELERSSSVLSQR